MDLKEVRGFIDATDMELLKLLHLRMEYGLRAGKQKLAVSDPERENRILSNLESHATVLADAPFLTSLFRQIMSRSRQLQEQNLKLTGFQGEHGAWGEIAISRHDPDMVAIPCLEFGHVFDAVLNGEIDFGMVPVENSLEGAVAEVNDMLVDTDLKIIGEIVVPVRQCLLALPGCDYREIRAVYSHPQALGQCRSFLSRNKLESRPFYDTAGAARWLARERPKSVGVIASPLAAELYGLDIIIDNIADHPVNSTRFVLLSKEATATPGDKCSLVFSTPHQAGALFDMLKIFADRGINLTRIESRPSRKNPGSFAFLVDFIGTADDPQVQQALELARQQAVQMKILGFYSGAKT